MTPSASPLIHFTSSLPRAMSRFPTPPRVSCSALTGKEIPPVPLERFMFVLRTQVTHKLSAPPHAHRISIPPVVPSPIYTEILSITLCNFCSQSDRDRAVTSFPLRAHRASPIQ